MTEETNKPTEEPTTPAQTPAPEVPAAPDAATTPDAPAPPEAPPGEKQHIFDDPKNVQLLLKIFFTCCVLLLPAQLLVDMHGHFKWEGWFGFYAFYGLVSCIILVLISKFVLRPLVMRDEDFYDKPAADADGDTEAGSHA